MTKMSVVYTNEVAGTSRQVHSNKNPYIITEGMLQSHLSHENRGRYLRQLYLGIAVSLLALSFGTSYGWSNPVVSEYTTKHDANNTDRNTAALQYSTLVSIMPMGCSIGIVPWSYTVNHNGPRKTLFYTSLFQSLSWVCLWFFTETKFSEVIRFFCGFFGISYIVCSESLLVDSVHRKNLLHLMAIFRSSVLLGVLLMYVLGNYYPVRKLNLICAGLAILPLGLLYFVPESPVYLYRLSEKKAEAALSWYRGRRNIYLDLRRIRKDIEHHKMETANANYLMYKKVIYKAFGIVLCLTFFQVFSGYYAFMFYTVYLWKESSKISSYLSSIVYGCFMYFSNFISTLVHYHVPFGVRRPLIVSCVLVAVILCTMTIYIFIITVTLSDYGILLPIMLCIYVLCYETGLSTYPDIIFNDYLPYEIHATAKTVMRIIQYFMIFLITKFIGHFSEISSPAIAVFMLALTGCVSVPFCYFFVIESKNKSLVQIQMSLGGNPVGHRGAYRSGIDDRSPTVI